MIGVLIVSIILSLDIFNKNSINILQNTVSNKFVNITLDTSSQISLFLTNSFGEEIEDNDRIFDIQVRYSTYILTNIRDNLQNLKIMNINSTKCQYKRLEGDKDNNYQNLFQIVKSVKCYDLSPYNIHIFGDENPLLPQGILQFFLNKCTNTTTKTNCLPQNVIDKKLGMMKLSFIFPNKDIDNLSTNPIINFNDGKVFKFASSIKFLVVFSTNT